MHYNTRKLLSQNFLHNRKLVTQLIGDSSIAQTDLVLEIGPGKGIITNELVSRSAQVVAVELDSRLCEQLAYRFSSQTNFKLYNQDFLTFTLPTIPYKVFANIPFAIESDIVRKLLTDKNPPNDCYVVLMKEFAERLITPNTMFTNMYEPWFDFSICHYFSKQDFTPIPSVDAVLFRFNKKSNYVLPWSDKQSYQKFITTAFTKSDTVLKSLSTTYDKSVVITAMQQLSHAKRTKVKNLNLTNWIQLYKKIS